MDQEKIGKFMAECRKKLNLTQQQVAEQLGVTNRAVSKWETGKSMPDSSIMLALCEILKISVNELLCGQRLNEAQEDRQTEQNAVSVVGTKRELTYLNKMTELLIFAGIIITLTFTTVVAVTTEQKLITGIAGCFVWGYGMWMRVRIGRALRK